ncbi:MAG: hypothetical protein GX597_24255 [Anaerolineaceae bacterium]|nr:hypothetical protein [Anaerolineaceae bacterium]
MKQRYVSIAMAVAVVATLLSGSAWPAGARAVRYDVSSIEVDCFTGMEAGWQEGNVLHLRGVGHTNVNISATPELNGINTTLADAEFNLANGNVSIRGTSSWQPAGIDGTWEGSWTFIANRGIVRGQAVAHGTGALSGQHLFLEIYDVPPREGDVAFCEGIGEYEGTVVAEGYILDTGAP